ncbi:MAG TPA: 3-oxoacyl-ACP reductase FabG [Clostridia bacterium]|jgi:3-oxoacyl-[acyl-carrier protein] reductase|nr:3-oxoacyl-ACP reductase FabG [Clostridia bacterium]
MRTVLITGASRGIGQQAAFDFLEAGYNVVVNYNQTYINEADYLPYKDHVIFIKADIADYSQVQKMFVDASNQFGNIDVVINNAAVTYLGLLSQMDEKDWDRLMDINLKGLFNVCKCAIPSMVNNKKGHIINISSMWGITGASCEVAYSASKAAVIGFTKALAKELAPSNILVNCIAPGIINTDMNKKFTKDELEEMIPLGKIGNCKDITDMMLYLANEKTSFITGQVFSINGGSVI